MEIPDKLLAEIKKAVGIGNKKKINSLLGCRQQAEGVQSSFDSELLGSTDRASALLGIFVSSVQDDRSNHDKISTVECLQALLMVTPSFETPFEATHIFLRHAKKVEVSDLFLCVSIIQQFFQETMSVWSVKISPHSVEGNETEGSRMWWKRFAEATASLIFSSSDDDNYDIVFQLFSGLLQSIFALTRSMDIQSFETAVQTTFHSKRHKATLVQVLRLATLTMPFLRSTDIEQIRQSISTKFTSEPSSLRNDISSVLRHEMELIASLLSASLSNATAEVQQDAIRLWKELVLQSLIVASTDKDQYTDSTKAIVAALQEMDVSTMQLWYSASVGGDINPWFRFDLASLSMLATYSSDIDTLQIALDHITDRDTTDRNPIAAISCDKVLASLFRESYVVNGIKVETTEDPKKLFPLFDGTVYYMGEGLFQDSNGEPVEILSPVASIVRKGISEYHDASQEIVDPESSIVQRLLWVVDKLIERKERVHCTQTAIFCYVTLCILYMEVPSSRTEVVQRIQELLCIFGEAANVDAWPYRVGYGLANLIVRSLDKFHVKAKSNRADVSNDFDPLLALVHDSLPIDLFSHLVRLLAPTTWQAKQRILEVSKSLLEYLYTCSCDSGIAQARARAGMIGMFELLVDGQCWHTLELEAWKLLTNAVVFDSPPLSISNRSWIYSQIADMIENDEFDEIRGFHFLRALIVRSSFFFTKDKETGNTKLVLERAFTPVPVPHSPHNLEEKQTEDIVSLFRLQLSLLQHTLDPPDSLSTGSRYAKESFARAREALLSTILTPGDGLVQMKELCNESATIESVDDYWIHCLNTVMCQFSIMLVSLLDGSINTIDFELDTMIDKIIFQEKKALEDEDAPQSESSSTLLWLNRMGLPLSLFCGRLQFQSSELSKLRESLLDFSIVLVLTPKLPLVGHSYIDFLYKRVVQAVGRLLERKMLLGSGKNRILSAEILQATATQFLSASSRVIRNDAFAGKCPTQEIESFIEPSIKYCKSLEAVSQDDDFIPGKHFLFALWSLYQVLGCERAAIVFIGHLERNLSTKSPMPQPSSEIPAQQPKGHRLCSLLTVRTGEDIDEAVQRVRLQIVVALKHCLLILSSRTQMHIKLEVDARATQNFNDKSSQIEPDFLLNVLAALSLDLRTGLNGQSGGITPSLFLAYLAAIEECVVLLYAKQDTFMSPTVMSFLMDAAKTLCSIMKLYPLEDATLFRSTFLIATSAIPSICREIFRRTFVFENNGPWGPADLAFCMDRILVFETLSECVSILQRWSALRNPNSMPWGDIVGAFHQAEDTAQADQDEGFSSDESVSPKPVPKVVHIQPEVAEAPQPEASKLRLRTKEAWSWALSCSFLSLEEKWQECVRVMTNKEIGDLDITLKCSGIATEFYRERQEELLQSLRHLSKLFVSTNSESTGRESTKHLLLEMIALNLPSAPRYRFCCLLVNVLTALVSAMEVIEAKLSGPAAGKTSLINSIGCAEATCCLSAWLCISNMEATDVTVGICHWYSILKRRLPRETSSNGKQESKDEMERLSKLLALVGRLQVKARKLLRTLKATRRTIPMADSLFSEGSSEMAPLISGKLSMIRKESKLEGGQSAFPDLPDSSDDAQPKQKPPKREVKKRKRESPVKRSRNRVVDMFLNLDDGIDEETKGNTDAFVDLEDFLVEG